MFHRPLSHLRGTPTILELSEARFKRFIKELQTYERKLDFEHTLDAFLDLYSSWRKKHEPQMKLRLVMLGFELHRLDPAFQCDLSFHDSPSRGTPHQLACHPTRGAMGITQTPEPR